MKAIWKNTVIAEATNTVVVDGNHYFPADSLVMDHFKPSETTSVCGWKGTANYYSVVVGGEENPDAAWYYTAPKEAAAELRDHVAFWRGVTISES